MSLHNFNWIDYSIIGIIVFSTVISLIRGFMREALSLIIWVGAFWVAYKFADTFSTRFLTSISSESVRYLLGFLIIFFATLVVGAIVNYFASRVVYQTGLSAADRVLGLGFGFARGVLLVGVLLLCAVLTNLNKHPAWASSQVLPQFSEVVNWLYSILPEKVGALAEVAKKEVDEKLHLPKDDILPDLKDMDTTKTTEVTEKGSDEPKKMPVTIEQETDPVFDDHSSNKSRIR